MRSLTLKWGEWLRSTRASGLDPSSFARDAKTLIEGGYRLDRITPIGQFRWSTHVELAARFSR